MLSTNSTISANQQNENENNENDKIIDLFKQFEKSPKLKKTGIAFLILLSSYIFICIVFPIISKTLLKKSKSSYIIYIILLTIYFISYFYIVIWFTSVYKYEVVRIRRNRLSIGVSIIILGIFLMISFFIMSIILHP